MPIVAAHRGPRFQRGGALADERAMYIEREADAALLAALEVGDYCLVFAPRQVGKSSLRVRAAEQLRARGIATAFVDLSAVGAEASSEDWYFSVTREIAASLGLAAEVSGFWDLLDERATPALQMRRFMAEVVLARVPEQVVVFVDETDVTLSLPFSRDDFFAAIRAMFNLRAEDPLWQRLSFCLFGVMTRDDLVEDSDRTPFNIECTEIRLRDFSRAELDGFAPGLIKIDGDAAAILDAVHGWTAGHPALSQRLLAAVVDAGVEPGREQELVDEQVASLFLERGRELDPVLGDTARRFVRGQGGPLLPRMLEIYERLLRGESLPAHGRALGPNGMQLLSRLRVAGLVGEDDHGKLTVRSRIVEQVFDLAWARSVAAERLLTDDLRRWLDGGRNPGDLLRGARLSAAVRWMEGRSDVTSDERDLVIESETFQRRRQRRLMLVVVAVAATLLAALMFGSWLLYETQRAREEAEKQKTLALDLNQRLQAALESEAKARQNERGYAASLLAQLGGREREALAQSLSSENWTTLETRPVPAVAQGLVDALTRARSLRTIEDPQGSPILQALAPDGRRVALAGLTGTTAGLWDLTTGRRYIQYPLTGEDISALAYSPRGDRLAIATSAGVELWSTRASERLALTPSAQRIETLGFAFSPDGALLATSTGALLDGETGELQRSLDTRGVGSIKLLAWTQDGASLLTIDDRRQINRWDPASGKRIAALGVLDDTGLALEVSATLIAASAGTKVWIWDAVTGARLHLLEAGRDSIAALRFSPDGTLLAGVGGDGIARIWDPLQGQAVTAFDGRGGDLQTLAWSADGELLATGGLDQPVQLWSLGSLDPLAELSDERNWIFQLAFSADGRTLLSTTEDGTALLWGLQTGLPTVRLPSHDVQVAAFSPSGRQLVTGERRSIRIWNLDDGQALRTLDHSAAVVNDALAWSADGSRIAAAEGRSIGLWEAATGRQVTMLIGHRDHVRALQFSRDGGTLASVGDDGSVRLWAADSGRAIATGDGHEGSVTTLQFLPTISPDADARTTPWLATGGEDFSVRLWSAHADLLTNLRGHRETVLALAVGGDGRWLASAGADASAKLWSLTPGQGGAIDPLPRSLDAHHEAVFAVCFTADARLVSASGYDLLLWPAESSAEPLSISEHRSTITALACAPRGDLVASAGRDGSIELWIVSDPVQRYVGFETAATVHQLRFSPDGARLLTVGDDGHAELWDTRHTTWLRRGCQLLLGSDGPLDEAGRQHCLGLAGG